MTEPSITAVITLLPELSRDRRGLTGGTYRPHILIGPHSQLEAPPLNGVSTEAYLGISFIGGPDSLSPGQTAEVTLALAYHPQVDYSSAKSGSTFTIREGSSIVGFGTVLNVAQQGAAPDLFSGKPENVSHLKR